MTALLGPLNDSMNPLERQEAAYAIQNLIHEEAAQLWLYTQMNTYGLSAKVQGFTPRPDDYLELYKVSLID